MNQNANNQKRGSRRSNPALNPLKYEIAQEFGVNLGPDATARQNGSVGGEITRRLVSYAKGQMGAQGNQSQGRANQ